MSHGALYTEDVVAQVGVEKTAGCRKNQAVDSVDSVDIEQIVKLSHRQVFIASESYFVRSSDFVSRQGQFCCPTHLYLVGALKQQPMWDSGQSEPRSDSNAMEMEKNKQRKNELPTIQRGFYKDDIC